MPRVTIITQAPGHPREGVDYGHVPDVVGFLKRQYAQWPQGARMYYEAICQERDVTPTSEREAAKLDGLPGRLYIVVYPSGAAAIIGAVGLAVVIAGFFLLYKPNIETPKVRAANAGSPNNDIQNRANSARVGGRVEDIYGTVVSVPTLLAKPYNFIKRNVEYEVTYMAVGRGPHDLTRAQEGETSAASIPSISVRAYEPLDSPNGSPPAPFLSIGPDPTDQDDEPIEIWTTLQLNDVVGQTLRAPDAGAIPNRVDIEVTAPNITDVSYFTCRAIAPDTIEINTVTGHPDLQPKNLDELIFPGDIVQIDTWAPGGLNLAGTYVVAATTSNLMQLVSPATVNANWSSVVGTTAYANFFMPKVIGWAGPFDVTSLEELDHFILNFACLQGLYVDDGRQQRAFGYYSPGDTGLTVEVELTQLVAGVPTGSPELFEVNLIGSATARDFIGATLKAKPTWTGPTRIRARRQTFHFIRNHDNRLFKGTIQDEVKWKTGFAMETVPQEHFGDVTTILVVQAAVPLAITVKDRKFNILASRKIPIWNGTTFLAPAASSDAGQIIIALARDPKIGAFADADIDLDGIIAAAEAVRAAFVDVIAADFNGTFDSANQSAEDLITAVAQAAHLIVYRIGNKLHARPDIAQDDSVLLLNHRNISPGTQTRSFRFGTQDNNDGISVSYVDAATNSVGSIIWPPDEDLKNVRDHEVIGLTSRRQALFHAYRAYHRLIHQNVALELTALEEAATMIARSRMLVADTTRKESITSSGEIFAVDGLELQLSQPVTGVTDLFGLTIHLQYSTGLVDAIPCAIVPGFTDRVLLADAPSEVLITNQMNGVPTTYMVQQDNDRRAKEFVLLEMKSNGPGKLSVSGMNYSTLYYQGDNLRAWMFFQPLQQLTAPNWIDYSPYEYEVITAGEITVVTDADRGGRYVHEGDDSSGRVILVDSVLEMLVRYSRCCWVKLADATNDKEIGSMTDGITPSDRFHINNLTLGHSHGGADIVTATWPDITDWHHACVTYGAGGVMVLYIDGVEVDRATTTDRAPLQDLELFRGMRGRCDDFREYGRELTAEEVFDIYRSTRYV
jgi:hypothetical protein